MRRTRPVRFARFEKLEKRCLLAAELGTEVTDDFQIATQSVVAQESIASPSFSSEAVGGLAQFASALAESGVEVVGPSSGSAVSRQLTLFGAGRSFLTLVENPASDLYWNFPDGTRLDGFQSLAAISEASRIPLPTDVISIETNVGRIEWQLLASEAPNTVLNFLSYVNGGVDGEGYAGTIFHRSEPDFVIQGGGFRPTSVTTTDIDEIRGEYNSQIGNYEHHIETFPTIADERGPESMSNVFGTYAMAKNSAGATSEYFFNAADNSFLDAQGFTVFAVDLDAKTDDGSVNPDATLNRIGGFSRVDVDPANDGTGGFSVFDNVPYTPMDEMVVIESITGSGIVSGAVFDDLDQDGVKDNGEAGIANVLVWSDANDNGVVDADEHSTTSDGSGNYSLLLTAGEHQIRQQTNLEGYEHLVTISPGPKLTVPIGRELSNANFGNSEARSLGLFALALADSGITFTGPADSEDVQRQLNLFTPSQDLVPYVEDANAAPAWQFPGGTKLDGFQTVVSLSQVSGIPLPSDVISIATNVGTLEWQLLTSEAPIAIENFLRYVNGGVDGQGYTGSILHRADPGFVVQGGGFRPTSLTTTDIDEIRGEVDETLGTFEHHIPVFDPIPDEREPGSRSNIFGTYGSVGGTSQYYFNLRDNSFLDDLDFTVFATDLDALLSDGNPNPASTIKLIEGLMQRDVDPSNDETNDFSVFDNVPYSANNEMVVIESIVGSGIIGGSVFDDLNQNGIKDDGEIGIEGLTVFSDANDNGVIDEDELSATTDQNGNYSLLLPAGDHTLRREPKASFFQTSPRSPDAHVHTLNIGELIEAQNFGVVELKYDFGDAPTASQSGFAASYPVMLAQGGARHIAGELFLGSQIDVEPNGQPDELAGQTDVGGDNGNAEADEDGVIILADIVANPSIANVASFGVNVSQAGKLDAWIDFNRDGDWDDAGEQIFSGKDVSAGSQNALGFPVPAGASPGTTAARFRLSSAGGLSPTGPADDGEVEDHVITILDSNDLPDVTVLSAGNVTRVIIEGTTVEVIGDETTLFRTSRGDLASVQILGSDVAETFTLDNRGVDWSELDLRLDGSGGDDSLRFIGDASWLDLTSETVDIQQISAIDLGDGTANQITIDALAVQGLASSQDRVSIAGGDAVFFADAAEWRMGDAAMLGERFIRTAVNIDDGVAVVDLDLPYAWHNPLQGGDVNNNGQVTSADALSIINELGRRLYSDADTADLILPSALSTWPGTYYDANADGRATALDALQVINELGRIRAGEGEHSEALVEDVALHELVASGLAALETGLIRSIDEVVELERQPIAIAANQDRTGARSYQIDGYDRERLPVLTQEQSNPQERLRAVDEFLSAAVIEGS